MFAIDNYDFKGKRAIIRVDFNVPLDGEGHVTDDTRIRAAIPTIKKVLEKGGAVILMSHLGRPKKNPDPKFSLEQIVPAIEARLGQKILFAGDCMGEKAAEMAKNLKPGEVMLLENLRFYAEEEGKPRGLAEDATDEEKKAAKKALKEGPQKEFVKKLASYADCYINDAFGTAHRAHASTALIADYFPHDKMFGYVMENELKAIDGVMQNPQRPFVAIVGGSKVSTKITIIEKLMEKCDKIIIGGGMTYTFAGAQGGKVGNSICEPDMYPVALEILKKAEEKGIKIVTSPDALIADAFSADANTAEAPADNIPDNWEGVDIGEQGKKLFREEILGCKTILWNGPVGVFEIDKFATGSYRKRRLLAHRRRRLGCLHQQVRSGRQGIVCIYGWRRSARVHGGQGAARRSCNPQVIPLRERIKRGFDRKAEPFSFRPADNRDSPSHRLLRGCYVEHRRRIRRTCNHTHHLYIRGGHAAEIAYHDIERHKQRLVVDIYLYVAVLHHLQFAAVHIHRRSVGQNVGQRLALVGWMLRCHPHKVAHTLAGKAITAGRSHGLAIQRCQLHVHGLDFALAYVDLGLVLGVAG